MGPDVFSHVRHFLAEKAKGSCRGRRDVHSEAAMRFVWTRPAAAGLAQAIGRRTAHEATFNVSPQIVNIRYSRWVCEAMRPRQFVQ
jgi:hypothetical protein